LANDYSIGNCVACRGLRGDEDSAHRKALRQSLLQLRLLPAEQAREVAWWWKMPLRRKIDKNFFNTKNNNY
jgi:hypothetical protein